ncbi:2'-5' RNA ligase family protein [Kitasatospora phosalacinea]|uniref:2'-5' RNA ligase family protein n=1 Tax=Kitasatospora phosalacinea TaxID=2065 RepID=UPI000AACDCC2|nr:2'-5' RNA ligase family protein [Kitasatospora phosalacinea]
MRRFDPTFGTVPWSEGLRVLQVYALPDPPAEPALRALVSGVRAAMSGAPIVPIPDERLHVTLDMVTDAPAHAVTARERAALAGALREALAGTAPVALLAGSATVTPRGVLIDLHPDGELADLQRRVRAAIHAVRGPDSTGYRLGVIHLSAGYAAADTDTDPLTVLLHRVRPGHAPLTLRRVALVEVFWHRAETPVGGASGWTIDWTVLDQVLLGPPEDSPERGPEDSPENSSEYRPTDGLAEEGLADAPTGR